MTSFSELNLDPRVLKAVEDTGYTTPTPIQAQAIPHALQGRDVLGIAQTGTGKTASFTLPMLTLLAKGRARARMPRSLVLAPTRELAAQVAENFETYAKHMKISMALLIGGVSFKDQDKLIDRGVDVLIATPGRLLDHFERGKLMLTGIEIMVVDEADRMLDMGFIPDIERIFKLTPFTRQTLFFSATMAPEITRITQEFLSNPVRVEVARQATTSETIDQYVCKHKPARRDSADKERRDLLRKLIDMEGDKLTNGIIFCNRKINVDIVAKSLAKHGYDAAPIHGDLDQSVRTRTLDGFRDGKLRLLVASDVAARGLDIPSVSHVFNFDIPTHSEDYVHRIGRTGRAGRAGKSISICFPFEEKYLTAIEDLVKKTIPVIDSPLGAGGADMAEADDRRGRRRDEDGRRKDRREEPRGKRGEDRPAEDRKSEDRAPEPRAEARPQRDRDEARKPRDRNDRNERGGRRGRDRDRDAPVIGMGDHVPAFLIRDLRRVDELMLEMSDDDEDEDAETETEAEAEAAPEAAAETPKPKKSRSRRGKSAKADAADEAATHTAPAPDAAAEPAEDEDAAVKPARKPRRSSRAKSADTAAADKAADKTADTDAAAPTAAAAEGSEPAAQPEQAAAPAKPGKKPRTRVSASAVIPATAEPARKAG